MADTADVVAARGCAQGAVLPPLPYEYSALEPFISARTLHFHHDKHHAKYVATTNEMIKGTDMEHDTIEEIIRKAHGGCRRA